MRSVVVFLIIRTGKGNEEVQAECQDVFLGVAQNLLSQPQPVHNSLYMRFHATAAVSTTEAQ